MLAHFKRLGKHSVVYGLANALGASISLLLLPLFTRFLAPAEYGALDLAIVLAAQVGVVLQLGLGSAVFKLILQDGDEGSRREVLSTAYYTILLFGLVVTALLITFADPIARVVLGDPDYNFTIVCVLVKGFCEAAAVVPVARLRILEHSVKYGLLNVGRIVVSVVMYFFILVVFHGGFKAVVIGLAAESMLFAAAASATAASDLGSLYSRTVLKRLLAFGLPLVPLAFGLTALSVGDRYLLRWFTDLNEVGRYAVANKLAGALNVVIRAFQVAWPAVLFSVASGPGSQRFYSRLLTYLVFVLGFAGLGISVFARELLAVFVGPSFRSAYVVVPVLVLAQIAFGGFYGTAIGSNLTGKTYYQTLSVAAALVVFVGVCLLLIPGYGMMGAAIGSASGYIALTAFSCITSLRVYHIEYQWVRVAVLLSLAAALAAVGARVSASNPVVDIGAKLGVVALYPVMLFSLGFLDKSERAALHRIPGAIVKRGAIARPARPT